MSRLPKKDGFTLIEVLLTIAFVAIISTILFSAVNVWRSVRHLQWQTIAYNIAKHKIEDIRNTEFASLPSSGSFSDSQMSRLPNASGQVTVSGADLKEITVTISWVQEGGAKNLNLKTLISEGGLNK